MSSNNRDSMTGSMAIGVGRSGRLRRFPAVVATLGTLLALAGLAACDGDNLFSGESRALRPRVTAILGPATVSPGQVIELTITGFAARNVAQIDLRLEGAMAFDTTITIEPPKQQVSQQVSIELPAALVGDALIATAAITDAAGIQSSDFSVTFAVFSPPTVLRVEGPDSVRLGQPLDLTIVAGGSTAISRLEVSARGAVNKDTVVIVGTAGRLVEVPLRLNIPSTANSTELTLNITPIDVEGTEGPTGVFSIPVQYQAPTVSFTAPDSVSPGGFLDLQVTASSSRQISAIKVELSRAVSKDTTVTLSPPLFSTTREIRVGLPGDITENRLIVRVYALDAEGVPGAVVEDTVGVRLGVPVIVSIVAPDSVQAGRIVDLRVTARGVRPITEIRMRYRGAMESDVVIPVTPSRNEIVVETSVTLPAEVRDTVLIISATAVDEAGTLSAPFTDLVRVRDTAPPSVTATLTQAQVSAGRTLAIRVAARDNVGLRQIGFAVVEADGDTVGTSSTLINTQGLTRDTTFNFLVPSSVTPQTLRVLGIAVDVANLRTVSAAASLAVIDSGVPLVSIQEPSPSATFPTGDSLLVTALLQDPTGIRSVTFKGIAIRTDPAQDTRVVTRFSQRTVNFPQAPSNTLPRDTTLSRYLQPIATDSTAEPVYIVVEATDSVGNVGTDTVVVSVGGPRVEIRTPANNSQVQTGGTLLIQAFAVDRTNGIDSLKIFVTGAQSAQFVYRGLASPDSIKRDTTLLITATSGSLAITAQAWNGQGVGGQTANPVTVNITTTAVADTAKPFVAFSLSQASRIELDDSIAVSVQATDNGSAGLRRIGVVMIALPDTSSVAPDTIMVDSVFTNARTGTIERTFNIRLADFPFEETDALRLPRRFTLQVHAFALDTIGNCGANTSTTLAAFTCERVPVGATLLRPDTAGYVRQASSGAQKVVTAVLGSSVKLPSGGTIADAVIDSTNQRLFLSNLSRNRVEVLDLSDTTFASPVQVGSEPWGMFINNARDSLMVANSGGTNVSFVPLNTLVEDGPRRLLTQNNVLFNVTTTIANGIVRYSSVFFDFSDRPQFIAQDANDRLLYSTKPTGAAPDGTIRVVEEIPGGVPEVHILFNDDALTPADNTTAIARIDSLRIFSGGPSDDQIALYDHVPGFPATVIVSPITSLDLAIDFMEANGSDIIALDGAWDQDDVGLSDTTYVSASGDREIIAFGEGAVGPTARIMLWNADQQQVSDAITVTDLVGNASERVLGVALDINGAIGAARGSESTYFFSNGVNTTGDLRLQGVFSDGVAGGAGGVALHPAHVYTGASTGVTLSFIATSNRTIKIVDTFHFFEKGEVPIRDNIVGQLRAAFPHAGENTVASNDPNFIVVKLYGITATGEVVIVNIRNKDID